MMKITICLLIIVNLVICNKNKMKNHMKSKIKSKSHLKTKAKLDLMNKFFYTANLQNTYVIFIYNEIIEQLGNSC